jgi:hypothetical protein
VIVEIQEMERALDEFKAAVERGETVGNLSRGNDQRIGERNALAALLGQSVVG